MNMKTIILERKSLYFDSAEHKSAHQIKEVGRVLISETKESSSNDHSLLRPGVREVLEYLKNESFTVVLCTDQRLDQTRLLLAEDFVEQFFDNIITARLFRSQIKKMLITSGTDYFIAGVFSDDTQIDLATELGLPCVAIRPNKEDPQGKEVIRIESVEEIDDAVAQAQIHYKIAARIAKNSNWRIIGLDGIDLVGKSYFSLKLSSFLKLRGIDTQIVRLSDFKNQVESTYVGEDEVEAYYFHAFNTQKLIDSILDPLKRDGVVDVTVLYFGENTGFYGKERHYKIENNQRIIIEGVHMYREPLIDYFDCKIFLFMDEQEALHRSLVRDIYLGDETKGEEYIKKNIPAHKMYSSRYQPIDISDFAIDNTQYRRPIIV